MTPAAFRRRLAQRVLGTVVTSPDVGLAELTAAAVDFVWIDLEHGALSARDVQPLAIAARAADAASLVRLRSYDDAELGAALDAGVQGVVIPRVASASEAERAVARLRYPPRGTRGVAARRASNYGAPEHGVAAEPVCMAQIESGNGVEEADAIAAVDGVDALVVGCSDLAVELGVEASRGSVRLRGAIERVQDACASAGIASGVAGPDSPDTLHELAGDRSTILVLGADVRIYASALRHAFNRVPQVEETRVGA